MGRAWSVAYMWSSGILALASTDTKFSLPPKDPELPTFWGPESKLGLTVFVDSISNRLAQSEKAEMRLLFAMRDQGVLRYRASVLWLLKSWLLQCCVESR